MNEITFTIQQQIDAKNARLAWLGQKETDYARAIQRLLVEQSRIYDEIVILELAMQKEAKT